MLEWSAQVASECWIVVDVYIMSVSLFPKFLAMLLALPMVMSVLLEGQIDMRVEWRSATMGSGEQFVMTRGAQLMLQWPADNLATQDLVGLKFTMYCYFLACIMMSQISLLVNICRCYRLQFSTLW